jgi:hypothetical protein
MFTHCPALAHILCTFPHCALSPYCRATFALSGTVLHIANCLHTVVQCLQFTELSHIVQCPRTVVQCLHCPALSFNVCIVLFWPALCTILALSCMFALSYIILHIMHCPHLVVQCLHCPAVSHVVRCPRIVLQAFALSYTVLLWCTVLVLSCNLLHCPALSCNVLHCPARSLYISVHMPHPSFKTPPVVFTRYIKYKIK